ncbi:sodium:solute symporter [Selenomonas dianae]|uniref:Sodium:solute symporter n=1 Tax=Selenomonas dianae TaxID=135079 RepID=A0ABN0T6X8_9FIRM|nr:sodium:solute symporter [Selenomonas dianae]WLD82454.1 sodium:solute symporter [Selenomonas dianae]
MHQGFTWIDTAVLVIYLLGVLLAGLYYSKKEMQGKEFFKGDGTIPWYVTCVSIFATLLSPISFLAIPGNSYHGSWIFWWAQLGMLFAIPLTIRYFLPIYSKLEIDTAYHYLQKRFESGNLRILGALMFIIYQLGRMSIIMYLPSMALAEVTGLDVNMLIVVMGVIAIIYSYSGGLKAVLYTDFIQGTVLIVGIGISLIVMISSIHGGWGTVWDTLTTGHKFMLENEVWMSPDIVSSSVFIIFIGGGLGTFASYISSQDIVQRFTTTTDMKQLNKMTLGNGVVSIFAATVFFLVGTALFVFYQQNPDLLTTDRRDLVLAAYITYELPVGLTGILLAALFAAAQSTLSTGINSVATSWVLDIQSVLNPAMEMKKQTRIAQFISLGIGILSIVVAIVMAGSDIRSAYQWFNSFIGLALGALAGMFVLGAFCPKANAKGAFIGFITATAVVLYLKYFVPSVSFWSYTLITIVISLVVGNLVSRITEPNYEAPAGTTVQSTRG